VATEKRGFIEKDISGRMLLERAYDPKNLQPSLSIGKALRLEGIVKKIYRKAGMFSSSSTIMSMLTIMQASSYQMNNRM